MSSSLKHLIAKQPYQAYTYSYPHKTAYRAIDPPIPLSKAWQNENLSQLFLYVHIPFCSYRCGFCNLFALARPSEEMVSSYVTQIKRQLKVTMEILNQCQDSSVTTRPTFHRFALGGGTPSYLDTNVLDNLLEEIYRHTQTDLSAIPTGIEVSPETVTLDKMHMLANHGIDRVSMGVQSFSEQEVSTLIRPQQNQTVYQAVDYIRQAGIPTLNLDLIYGIDGQTKTSFLQSLDSLMQLSPEEVYLYPLYVRPETGLDKIQHRAKDNGKKITHLPVNDKMGLYQAGRDYLLAQGYEQVSMRMFAKPNLTTTVVAPYRCQEDGMVGIGCGARSYTQKLHYAHEYGVSRHSVYKILQHYMSLTDEDFAQINFGFRLDSNEQQRRYIIQSLMLVEGLDRQAYRDKFGTDCLADLPQLNELVDLNLATIDTHKLTLTADGLAYADTIGPWLISEAVQQKMQNFD